LEGYRIPPNYSLRYYGEFPYPRCPMCGQEEIERHTIRFCLAARRRWTRRFAGLLSEALDAQAS
jgi:hypothetical protein